MEATMSASIGNIASNLVSFVHVILWCVLFSWIFALQDFYFCFRPVIRSLPRLFLHMSKCCRHLSRIFSVTDDTPEPCYDEWETDTPTSVNVEDLEIVFQTLGLDSCKRQQIATISEGSSNVVEVASVFDKVHPCLDEVREAFNIFDGNNDGFIDANELEKVIGSMGFTRFSGEEYKRMIMAFDHDDDGKIDFEEFVKLMKD